ncbi:MAG: AmmeMemoRadiSam system protein B [Acidobacteriota bacterium]|nr:AmmeMemoRadiSam system protein B [Acidobacteriota bacterium]
MSSLSDEENGSNPRIRAVEVFPVKAGNQDFICLRDPEGFAEQPLFLNPVHVFLVSRMDGNHSLRDIQSDFARATGDTLPLEALEGFVRQLDEQHYLDSPRFRNHYQSLAREFKSGLCRPARHAGLSYPGQYEELESQLKSIFEHPEGPGNHFCPDRSRPLRGLIAPHIDFSRGGPTYAHAYKALAEHPGADTFVLFGTCHTPMPQRFSISGKTYETPLGAAKTDRDFIERLFSRLGHQYSDDFPHRAEHSIEFQAVCLRYLLGGKQDFRIIPILVGSFHDIYSGGRTAAEDPEINGVAKALRETIAEHQGRVCIIAGADLAHVGVRFGDPAGPTEESLREVERADKAFLDLAASGDAEGVFRSIAADNDSRRVCGYPSIYMALRCIDNPQGKLLQYRQWADLNAGAAVTFAAMAFY